MARAIDATELQRKMCALCNQDYYDEPCDPRDCVGVRAINEAPILTPQWISVEERLPEPGERVLATNGNIVGEAYITNALPLEKISAARWKRHYGASWMAAFDADVTHWMPLPDPPNGKEAPHE